ncbi:MAG: hypothetical protein E7270_02160 [Lachnospiraceae bacterium]|nr:hypothetical protein [Lachnospiraceae bacterium]MBQ4068298.1 hypothetical protein [Lachnospiraceae bacterium]
MAGISTNYFAQNSGSVGTLFSSLNTSSGVSSTTSLLSDYYSIRNGSYKKLLTAYYDKLDKGEVESVSNSTSVDSTKTLAQIKSVTTDLSEATSDLLEKGSKSVFSKKDGEYDMNAIYDSVKNFVDSYNEVIEEGSKASSTSIERSTNNLINTTSANAKNLAKLGIKIGSDDKLTIDEKVFKESSAEAVKSMFNGAGSYAYNVAAKASQMMYNVNTEANKSATYGSSGSYSYNYSAGNIYDSMF